ncbi:hypothetical protein H2204_012061 [Knufia peltigerae]|uniref:Zn(2)-C6 fungal-type domain-containing protein n=1 Tax=Knufia peltigerae TaxID=1002370 RepID=A0AA39CSP3_9EURO|nr:hypothetical protein H2204_012061 [Knufia peltigerae]
MQRPPRKLHYLKCHQCRKDRQKCTPTDRCWPSRKCDRCIKFSYPCSPNVTARGEAARPLKPPEIPQGKQPASLDFNLENHDFGADYTAAQPGRSSLHNMENPSSDTSQDYPGTSSIEGAFAETFAPGRVNASCTIFFSQLKLSRWNLTTCCMALESLAPEDTLNRLLLGKASVLGEATAIELQNRLLQREGLVASSFVRDVRIRQEMAKGSSRDKAVRTITAGEVSHLLTSGTTKGKSQSALKDIIAAARRIREGDRWRELVEVFGAREVLLVDAYHAKCRFRFGKLSECDIHTEFGDVKNLECCPESQPSFSIDRIVKKGTDEIFATLKAILLTPELQMQVTLRRLSGLTPVIHRLFGPDKIDRFLAVYSGLSPFLDVKLNLGEHDSDWFQKYTFCPEGLEEAKPFDAELLLSVISSKFEDAVKEAKLSSPGLLHSEMSSKIEDALGYVSFQTASESDDGSDVWDFRDDDASDEDTSEDDYENDGDEEDDEKGDGKGDDKNDGDPDEFSGINEEDFGFDQDFCIHFQNSDAFASFSL